MIERVARALAQRHADYSLVSVDARTTDMDNKVVVYWTLFISDAVRAIEAMREPTEAMKACGHGFGWHGAIQDCHDAEGDMAGDLWDKMIDLALKDAP